MPQSLAAILVHVVFSTKNCEPLIKPEIESELYPYLSTACQTANEYDERYVWDQARRAGHEAPFSSPRWGLVPGADCDPGLAPWAITGGPVGAKKPMATIAEALNDARAC
jgi:hypothetical protein